MWKWIRDYLASADIERRQAERSQRTRAEFAAWHAQIAQPQLDFIRRRTPEYFRAHAQREMSTKETRQ